MSEPRRMKASPSSSFLLLLLLVPFVVFLQVALGRGGICAKSSAQISASALTPWRRASICPAEPVGDSLAPASALALPLPSPPDQGQGEFGNVISHPCPGERSQVGSGPLTIGVKLTICFRH